MAFAQAHHLAVVADQRGAAERLARRNRRRHERGLRRHARRVRPSPRRDLSRPHRLDLDSRRPRRASSSASSAWTTARRPGPISASAQPAPEPGDPAGRRRQHAVHPATRSPSSTISPPNLDGTGECIGIIELGGGFNTADLKTYFSSLGLPAPTVTSVSVDGGTNTPTGSAGRPRRRGHARHRGRRRHRPQGQDRRLLHPQYLARVPRRDHPGRPRHREQALGHLDQLGRARVELDRPGISAIRPGVSGRGRAGRHDHASPRATTARATASSDGTAHVDFPGLQPQRPGLRRHHG